MSENQEVAKKPVVVKKRGRKPKKQVTPEEMKAMLIKGKDELHQVVKDLESDFEKVKPLNLSRVNELISTTIQNLRDDLEDMNEDIKEIENLKQ
jgi:hypothetical protein